MTTNLAEAEKTFNHTFYRTLMGWSGNMLQCSTPIVDDVANAKLVDVYGLGAWTAQSGIADVTTQDIRAASVTSSPAVWELLLTLTNKQVRDTDNILESAAQAAAGRFMEQVSDAFFLKLLNSHTTAHPENGVSGSPYAANGGGTVYFADNFDMTFVNGGTATQANLFSVALGQTGLETLIAARVAYYERGGERASMPGEKPLLLTGPTKMFAAADFADQTQRLYTGSGVESAWSQWLGGRVTVPNFTGSNWGLLYRRQFTSYDDAGNASSVNRSPVWSHLRKLPEFRLVASDKSNTVNVIGEAEYSVGYMPFEGDWLYSRP